MTGARNKRSALLEAVESSVASGAREASLDARELSPMLAEAAEGPFAGADWIFELKIDGYRALLQKDGDQARIVYRRGREMSAVYPDLVEQLKTLPVENAILDGEIAVLAPRGRPSFSLLQQRSGLTNPRDIAASLQQLPCLYFAFDLLALEGHDLRGLPLLERKRLLRQLLSEPRPEPSRAIGKSKLLYIEHVAGSEGERLFSRTRALGLEGVVGKKASSTYRAGRSRDWRKLRVERTADLAIVGFLTGAGSRETLGSLHLAAWDESRKQFVYAGAAGSGLKTSEIDALAKDLLAHAVTEPPCIGAKLSRRDRWSAPRRVCEVRYFEVTPDGLLRQPVFLRMRDDKTPQECPPLSSARAPVDSRGIEPDTEQLSAPDEAELSPLESPEERRALIKLPERALRETPGRAKVTNPHKLLWPEDNISKSDLVDYYRTIAPYILPWVRDRPATLTRYPDGIAGKSFFQKHAPSHTPDWVRVAQAPGSDEIQAIVCDDVDTLVYVANLANIPLHIPHARLTAPDRPDTVTIDLDPKSAPFGDVIRIALALREACEQLGVPCFIKTSGQSGLHVILPLGGLCSHDEAKIFAELLARLVEARHPKLCTLQRMIEKRQGRVYLDIGQNGESKTVAAAYSVRPIAGARASTPLLWDEVNERLDPSAFTLRTLPARAKKLGADPLLEALVIQPDLERALARLSELSKSPSAG
jgi:bifunctional non-homologous end joining protein LigD